MTNEATKGEAKKSFVLYCDYREHLALLDDEQRGRLLMALLEYVESGKEPEMGGALMMAYSFIRAQIDRDAARYEEKCRKRREAGKQGGRPPKANADEEKQTKAKKANGFFANENNPDTDNDNGTDNENDNGTDNDNENDIKISPDGDIPITTASTYQTTPHKSLIAMYHYLCPSFPKLRSAGEARKKAISARWKEYNQDIDTFQELFAKAEASSFLKGKNARNWSASFDWLMNSANMAKVLEGKYDDHEKGQQDDERGTFTNEPSLTGFRMAE
jgi:hypothetical protein